MEMKFSTENGVLTSKTSYKGSASLTCDVDQFYDLAIRDTYTPSGSEETIRFGNVDAVTYTLTDTDSSRTFVGYGNHCLKTTSERYGLTMVTVHGIYLS